MAEVHASLNWHGGPQDFSLGQVSGRLGFTVMNGQVIKVNPGAGRLFGLLSIAALPRRLSLDFRDLFEDGFVFDRIEARLRLEGGDAYTRLFYMKGPAARVDFNGRIGLGARDYDQVVTITPHISNTLPLVGALTGGPIGAVALFITQKLLEPGINKLTQYHYRVTGSWDDPEIRSHKEPIPATPLPELSDSPLSFWTKER
jgi:uncharacterized protein YhdP